MSSTNREADFAELKQLLGAVSEYEVKSGRVTIWRENATIPCGIVTGACGHQYNFSASGRIIPPGSNSQNISLNMQVYFRFHSGISDQDGFVPPTITSWVARNDLPKSFFKPERLRDFIARAFVQWRIHQARKKMSPRT